MARLLKRIWLVVVFSIFQDQAAALAWCQCDLISEQKRMTHFSAVSHSDKNSVGSVPSL